MGRKEVVFVLGGPGSGKGTHCERIASEFGYKHLSTGDLLREEQKKDSELATKIADCIRDGQLVPSSTMVALVKEAIIQGDSERFLLDGFPRSKDNLDAWFEVFSDDEVQVSFTLFLHCPKEELKKRLLERGETSGRADDNVGTVLKRFDTFEKESMPVVAQLQSLGMVDPIERTLALIKPDAVESGNAGDIVARAEKEGFVVVGKIEGRTWSKEDAEAFYSEHSGKPFFDTLVAFMTSGPIVQLCLEKVGAIKAWRKLAGPTNAADAKAAEPSSLRALYGTDGTKNAIHGSDSFASALREVNLCFRPVVAPAAATTNLSGTELKPEGEGKEGNAGEAPKNGGSCERGENGVGGGGVDVDGYNLDGFAAEEKTLALLKPGVSELHSDDILSILAYRGFTVLKATTRVMEEAEARKFFQQESTEPWFEELCTSMAAQGETTVLCMSRTKAVASLQSLVGPADPKKAKESLSRSLRGIFGDDLVNNAVHASCSLDNATRELDFWFPGTSQASAARSKRVGAAPGDPKYEEMMAYMKDKVDPVISPLLQRVLKARPNDVASFAAQDLQQQGASVAS